MNGTIPSAIKARLSVIGDLYRSILELTKRVATDFSFDALDEALKKRALLLLRIDGEEGELRAQPDGRCWAASEHARDIREQVSAIMELDRALANRASGSLARVGAELSSLARTSHAAKAYAKNIRT